MLKFAQQLVMMTTLTCCPFNTFEGGTATADTTRDTAQDEWEVVRIPMPSDTISGHRWLTLLRSWDEYLNYPSTENAANVYTNIPQRPFDSTEWPWHSYAVDSISRDLRILAYNAWASDRNAVRLLFGLFEISDGDFSESLCIDLGRLIRIDPQLFLEELHNHMRYSGLLDGLLGNLGDEYVDLVDGHSLERELRVTALRTVDIDSLITLRDSCIAELKSE